MQYRDLKNVAVTIDGMDVPLETALKDGNITEEDILCYALELDMIDEFKKEQAPPLAVDFHHWQGYTIPFPVTD